MEKITEQTLRVLREKYTIGGLYKTTENDTSICPHINALVNIGLAELGFAEEAANNIALLLKSGLYDSKHKLFYREMSAEGEVTNSNFNACKNALMALAFYAVGMKENANKTLDAMFNSPLFDTGKELFFREYNGNKINSLIITQTNLWSAITLLKLGRNAEVKRLVANLSNLNLDGDSGMFFSHDCESGALKYRDDTVHIGGEGRHIFADDQALAIIAYSLLGEDEKSEKLMDSLLKSGLYDSSTGLFNRSMENGNVINVKSTYKNSLCGIALGMLGRAEQLRKLQTGMEKYLYDENSGLFNMSQTDNLKVPDNCMLALMAMEYDNLKHKVF